MRPLPWEWLTAVGAGAGLVAATYAATCAVAGVAIARSAQGQPPAAALVERDEVHAALVAFETLKAGTERLRRAEREATARTQSVADDVAAAEYGRAADAIRSRLQLAETNKRNNRANREPGLVTEVEGGSSTRRTPRGGTRREPSRNTGCRWRSPRRWR